MAAAARDRQNGGVRRAQGGPDAFFFGIFITLSMLMFFVVTPALTTFGVRYFLGEKASAEIGIPRLENTLNYIWGEPGSDMAALPPYEVGDRVYGKWLGGAMWYSGKIYRAHDDGTFDIAYDDGDFEANVETKRIRLYTGQSVRDILAAEPRGYFNQNYIVLPILVWNICIGCYFAFRNSCSCDGIGYNWQNEV